MSTRRQLYDRLLTLPNGDPMRRVTSVAAFLDSMPADEAAETAWRLLALTIAYEAEVAAGIKSTLTEFFATVDRVEQGLMH